MDLHKSVAARTAANVQRLLIVVHLMNGKKSVSDLLSLVGGTQAALSQH
ncbi:ArsR family transcriptional regulator [Mesorhizobium sp. BR1-1-4]|nr:ArsR family transcriptional regulator [Mesorhizobium sp. CO1-1-2]MBZ9698750.1 ArsR family transcriptional regulator [Mesorhizobium sp. CO1-1-9]MBZ9923767.1 ArsR family transcriptional regulator [Mesorhizobium sp. BR1-1-4]